MSSAVKLFYPSTTAVTFTLASLASDTNLLAGRESALVDNTTNLYPEYWVSFVTQTGTSPTAGTIIQLWAVGCLNTSYAFPTPFAGADANISAISANWLQNAAKPLYTITVDSTNNRPYHVDSFALSPFFGGIIPPKFSFWVVQNTAATLNASGHTLNVSGYYPNIG
jgi:hypothetical protein